MKDDAPRSTEAQRHAAESEVRAALELMPQLVWTTTPDGYHDYYNQRWYDFTAMPRPGDPNADAEGWNWKRYLHPDDYERTVERWSRSLRTGEAYEIEYRFREAATGEYLWFLGRALPQRNADGAIVRWFGTCTLIDDQVKLRERLAESEERFRNSTQHSDIGHALVSLDGRYLQVNPAFARTMGMPAEQIVGKSFSRLTHPDDRRADLVHVRRLLAGEVDSFHLEKRYLRQDGSYVWTQVNASLVRDSAGAPLYFVSQVQDLTERRSLEAKLRESSKLEAVGRLAGGVAHDFNNVLAIIANYAEFVLDELPAESPLRADLKEVRAAAERGAGLTRQLLTFASRHLRRPTGLDVSALLRESERMLRQIAGAAVEVLVETGATPATIFTDPSEVDQLLLNLAINARDAMPSGGVLQLTSSLVTLGPAPDEKCLPAGEYVRLTVSDTGVGIPESVLPQIFEPFFSTKGASGTGLGLATVYGIVARNSGRISVTSRVGEGTQFEILLPFHQLGDGAQAMPDSEWEGEQGSGTVLLVEDEGALRNVSRRLLERAGYRVIEARHGADALAMWAEWSGEVQLLVTDLVMPELGGRELAEALRRERGSLPVIFMSGYTDDEITRRALEDPSVAFLAKPFSPRQLLEAVGEMFERSGVTK